MEDDNHLGGLPQWTLTLAGRPLGADGLAVFIRPPPLIRVITIVSRQLIASAAAIMTMGDVFLGGDDE